MNGTMKGIRTLVVAAAVTVGTQASTLIMMGDRDIVRPEHAVEMFRLIPNARLAVFAGSDHFLLFTSPGKVLATLTPFLAESVAGR